MCRFSYTYNSCSWSIYHTSWALKSRRWLPRGAIAIFFIAYGRDKVLKTFHLNRLKTSEDLGALAFVLVATLGVIYGAAFFGNVIWKGTLGKLFSSGTIFLMNFAVGYKVLAGIGVLLLIMIGTLRDDEEEGLEDDN